MGGDLSAVIASASRRPRTSKCLVKAGSRPVQMATPAFQPTPGLPRFPPRSSGVLSTIFDKIVGHLTLFPQGPRPRSKPNLVEFTVIKVKRNLPSMSFYESHRRQPSDNQLEHHSYCSRSCNCFCCCHTRRTSHQTREKCHLISSKSKENPYLC